MVIYALKKNSHKAPYGGHQFNELGTVLRGDSFDELVEKLKNFRLMNARQLGKPDQDILHYYAENWPWLVERTEGEFVPTDANFESWKSWIHGIWNKAPSRIVATAEAKTRWAVCEKCPFNRPMQFEDSPEVAELKRRAFLLKRGIDVPSNIGFCAVHRADIGVLSFIDNPEDFSKKRTKGGSYEDCWV